MIERVAACDHCRMFGRNDAQRSRTEMVDRRPPAGWRDTSLTLMCPKCADQFLGMLASGVKGGPEPLALLLNESRALGPVHLDCARNSMVWCASVDGAIGSAEDPYEAVRQAFASLKRTPLGLRGFLPLNYENARNRIATEAEVLKAFEVCESLHKEAASAQKPDVYKEVGECAAPSAGASTTEGC